MAQTNEITARLKGKSYQELKKEMSELSTEMLLDLLNNKSSKIGDTASSLLNQRRENERLAEAILQGKYTTKDGKVRAANTLLFVKADSKAVDDALLFLTRDKNERSAGNALFALVALRRERVIPELEKMKETLGGSSRIKDKIELAIKALVARNPKIYSPNYGG